MIKIRHMVLPIVCLVFVLSMVHKSYNMATKNDSANSLLFTATGSLSEPLLKLAQLTDVSHNGTLQSLVEGTQKKWLRKPGLERWEMEEIYENKSPEFMPLFVQLGLTEVVTPKNNYYDYALILGATVDTVIKRLDGLNVEVKQIVLLTGQRSLTPEEKAKLIEHDIKCECLTETDMMVQLFKRSKLANLKSELIVVDTPMKKNAEGKDVRPTTGDTIRQWIEQYKPAVGSCIAISTQPFVSYQDTVIRTYLPKEFHLETVGNMDSRKQTVALYLDNIARWLYQELEKQKIENNSTK